MGKGQKAMGAAINGKKFEPRPHRHAGKNSANRIKKTHETRVRQAGKGTCHNALKGLW